MTITPPQNNLVRADGTMTEASRIWANEVTNLQIIIGSGTPEGNIEAPTKRLYMDTSGTAGSILYIKRDAEIAGDTSKGWILV